MHVAVLGVTDLIDDVHESIVGRQAIVCAARDGKYAASSRQYHGQALQLFVQDVNEDQRELLRTALQRELGNSWNVELLATPVIVVTYKHSR